MSSRKAEVGSTDLWPIWIWVIHNKFDILTMLELCLALIVNNLMPIIKPLYIYSSDDINEGYKVRYKIKRNGNNTWLYKIKSFMGARSIFTLHSPPQPKNLEGVFMCWMPRSNLVLINVFYYFKGSFISLIKSRFGNWSWKMKLEKKSEEWRNKKLWSYKLQLGHKI